ncbi:DUF393 domain-containing protein [Thioclava sp. BHET1]|uniref:Thiol-disulfide oxidoreductase n=1 Tax=Thioclava dalianensis TaxID=1185766 RepID=A0A074U2U1_9RHOB|nr:DUF393 domain-containing protein [Thioclava dalianensis]KEP68977.1 hypothetical protein DL1_07795 [Thioclava dalianensis]TMV91839.1 DUF393 domain-containing protein [Thioclava sp. BHET1]SFN73274.1 Predicted thiol-disulfide oxidoreductase YuxK, DCC family [Thioclava dalianensis]
MSEPNATTQPAAQCSVYYDGACPLCRAEIGLYRKAEGAEALDFVDVSQPDVKLPEGLSHDAALGRFHLHSADGRLVSGGAAFAALWSQLPRWRYLGRIARWPVLRSLLELAYRVFLKLRPLIVRIFVALQRRRAK